MDAAGLKWSILSAFRDDYRQRIASGIKAGASNSLHGGMRARPAATALAAPSMSPMPMATCTRSGDWLDANGAKYGLHRPMPGYDPAHIQQRGDCEEDRGLAAGPAPQGGQGRQGCQRVGALTPFPATSPQSLRRHGRACPTAVRFM